MTLRHMAFSIIVAACTASIASAQEPSAVGVPTDEAGWQKQCADRADYDKLEGALRSTFMIECVAGAKLNAPQKPAEHK